MIDQVRNLTDGSIITPLWYCDFDPTTGNGVSGAQAYELLLRTDISIMYYTSPNPSPTAWVRLGGGSGGTLTVQAHGVAVVTSDTLNFTGDVSIVGNNINITVPPLQVNTYGD